MSGGACAAFFRAEILRETPRGAEGLSGECPLNFLISEEEGRRRNSSSLPDWEALEEAFEDRPEERPELRGFSGEEELESSEP